MNAGGDVSETSDDRSQGQNEPIEDEEALIAALVELDHHVGRLGWDQPPRLFALVRSASLLEAEPQLAEHLGVESADELVPGALSSIEQEGFNPKQDPDLEAVLGRVMWPEDVDGCALSCVRTFLPQALQNEIPEDPVEAADFVAEHPEREEIRLVAGVLRGGSQHAVARLVSHPDDLLGGKDLAPGVLSALASTLW
ncbi:PPA1309 family protein [Propioniferax innocua]|uniref:PPA1309 family protein n=1 Tax=Propioniferax innocua TaxID=1753 RepID=UPI0011503EE8|nr:PPA1309 family protein [Propioniferax innocua]